MKRALQYFCVAFVATAFIWTCFASQGACSAAEVASSFVQGCVCKIDEKAKTLTLTPFSEQKDDLDPSVTKTLAYDSQTQFTLKCTVRSVDLGGARSKKLQIEDAEVKNPSALPGHKVKITFTQRGGRTTLASVNLIPGWGADSDAGVAGVGGLDIRFSTKCSCASP